MFDTSKIQGFTLLDLCDRTLRIEQFTSDEATTVAAFDINTGDTFILECVTLKESKCLKPQ